MDDEAKNWLMSETRKQETRVKHVAADNFDEEIISNPDVKHAIVEVFKPFCGACAVNGIVFNSFSRKLERHGYSQDVHCYRVNIDNKLPLLGNFYASPNYVYIRKDDDNKVTEILTLSPAVRPEKFVEQIQDLTGLPGLKERIRLATQP